MSPETYYQQGKEYAKQKRFNEARDAFLAAAAGGYAKAECLVGLQYLHGQEGFPCDKSAAYQWLLKSAKHGLSSPDMEFNLGRMLEKGDGVAQDLAAAVFWYQRAATHSYNDLAVEGIVKLAKEKCLKFASVQPSFPLSAEIEPKAIDYYALTLAAEQDEPEARTTWAKTHLLVENEETLAAYWSLQGTAAAYRAVQQSDLQLNESELTAHRLRESSYEQVYAVHTKCPGLIGTSSLAIHSIPLPRANREAIFNELKILEKLHSPVIPAFYGQFEWHNKLNLILELTVCSLDKLLSSLPTTYQLGILLEIAQALTVLHAHDIIHRDLNPRHIFIGKDLHARLANFTIAKRQQTLGSSTETAYNSSAGLIAGTLNYLAPEAFENDGTQVSFAADIYAFGLIVWTLAKQEMLYSDKSNMEIMNSRLGATESTVLTGKLPSHCLTLYPLMLQKCCAHKPTNRSQAAEVRELLCEETRRHPVSDQALQQVFDSVKTQIQPRHQKFYPGFFS